MSLRESKPNEEELVHPAFSDTSKFPFAIFGPNHKIAIVVTEARQHHAIYKNYISANTALYDADVPAGFYVRERDAEIATLVRLHPKPASEVDSSLPRFVCPQCDKTTVAVSVLYSIDRVLSVNINCTECNWEVGI